MPPPSSSDSGAERVNPVDRMVRSVSLSDARERYDFIWREVNAALLSQTKIQRTLYFDALLKSARLIMAKLEEKGDFNEELWVSYRQLIGHCVLSYDTVEMPKLLKLYQGVVRAVLKFPSRPVGLLNDYRNCIAAQREQYQLAYMKQQGKQPSSLELLETSTTDTTPLSPPATGRRLSKKSSDESSAQDDGASLRRAAPAAAAEIPAPRRPDIEFGDAINAAVPTLASQDLLRLLNDLPTRMSLAHSNGILHLKLTNPLSIPQCSFVTTGYGCDTCKLQGLHAAFQAMLYDTGEEGEEKEKLATGEAAAAATGTTDTAHAPAAASASGEVRSDAQIAKKRFHGFDVCCACAVYFFLEQKKNFIRCLTPPHEAFVLGRASGVRIVEARYEQRNHRVHPLTDSNGSDDDTCNDPRNREGSLHSLPLTPPSSSGGTACLREMRGVGASAAVSREESCQHTDPTSATTTCCNPPSVSRSAAYLPTTKQLPTEIHAASYSAFAPQATQNAAARTNDAAGEPPMSPNAPPLRPPRRHLNRLATYGGDTGAWESGRRRSSGSSMSSMSSGHAAPLPPKFRAPPSKASKASTIPSPTFSRSSSPYLVAGLAKPNAVTITVSIAPYGARPIAWVLPRDTSAALADTLCSSSSELELAASPARTSLDGLLPPSTWKSRCVMQSDMTYKRQVAAKGAARRLAGGGTPLHRSPEKHEGIDTGLAQPPGERRADGKAFDSAPRTPRQENDDSGPPDTLALTARPDTTDLCPQLLMLHPSDSGLDGKADGSDSGSNSGHAFPQPGGSRPTAKGDTDSVDDASDVCIICLCTLSDERPVIETKCHHFFHVECIEGFARINEDTCPLCRRADALPDLSVQSALEGNIFHITLQLTEEESARESVTVCVGSVVTRGGVFENIMSVSAATCVVLKAEAPTAGQRARLARATATTITPLSKEERRQRTTAPGDRLPSRLHSRRKAARKPKDKDPRMRAVREGLATSPSRTSGQSGGSSSVTSSEGRTGNTASQARTSSNSSASSTSSCRESKPRGKGE